jgi:hypothetical protein
MIAALQRLAASRLFHRQAELRTRWQVVWWWETRRPLYNLIVGTAGVLSCLLLLGLAAFSEHRFGEAIGLSDPPLFALFLAAFYGIAANICFTGGWIAELLARSVWREDAGSFGEIALLLGTLFSVALTLLPVVLVSLAVLVKLLTSQT